MTIVELLRQSASRFHDRTFLEWHRGQCTYGQMVQTVERVRIQWEQLGIGPGDRVVLLVESKPTFIRAWLGLAAAGAVAVPVNPASQPGELATLLTLIDPVAVAVDSVSADRLSIITSACSSCPVVVIRDSAELLSLEAIDGYGARASGKSQRVTSAAVEYEAGSGSDLVSIIYTSGSTGKPKGVMHSHRTYVLTGEAFASWLQLDENDRLYLCLPLFHLNAQAYSVMGAIAAGACIVAVPRFNAAQFWDDMRKYQVTQFNFVGAMLSRLIQQEPHPRERNHGVRLAYGASRNPPAWRSGTTLWTSHNLRIWIDRNAVWAYRIVDRGTA